MGMCYRLANRDITEKEIIDNPKSLGTIPFCYGAILSSYQKDDIYDKFERIVRDIIKILADAYLQAYKNEATTSVSNFMKTDQKYYNEIVPKVIDSFDYLVGQDLKENFDLLKR